MRVLKLPTAPDDYAFMLAEDYDAAVQNQYQLIQVLLRTLSLHLALTALPHRTKTSPLVPCLTFAQQCYTHPAPYVWGNFQMSLSSRLQHGCNLKHELAFCRRQEVCLSSCRYSLGSAKGCWLAVQTIASPIMTS